MNAGELRMPAAFAWFVFFVPGAVLVIASIVRMQIDGVTLIGAVLLVIWAWLIRAFTREFWAARPPVDPAEGRGACDPTHSLPSAVHQPVSPYLSRLDRMDGVGTRGGDQ